jgi:hypothetical protein
MPAPRDCRAAGVVPTQPSKNSFESRPLAAVILHNRFARTTPLDPAVALASVARRSQFLLNCPSNDSDRFLQSVSVRRRPSLTPRVANDLASCRSFAGVRAREKTANRFRAEVATRAWG